MTASTARPLQAGDVVWVDDPALADLRRIMREATGSDPAPNHHGTVHRVRDDGKLDIVFDDGQLAPYPAGWVHLLYPPTPDPAPPAGPPVYRQAWQVDDGNGGTAAVVVRSPVGDFHWELADLEATLHLDGLPDRLTSDVEHPHAWQVADPDGDEPGVLVRAQYGLNVCWWFCCPSDATPYPPSLDGMEDCATTFCDFDGLHRAARRLARTLEL